MASAKRVKLDSTLTFEEIVVQKAFKNSLLHVELKPSREINNVQQFVSDLSEHIKDKIERLIKEHRGIKLWLALEVEYAPIEDASKQVIGFLRTKARVYHNAGELDDIIQSHLKEFESKNANFMRAQSGLALRAIKSATICVSKHQPLVGRAFKALPRLLKGSKSIVNVKNNDERCFGYALISALHPVPQHPNRARTYDPYFEEFKLDNLAYPISPEDVPAIEEQIQINVNVYSFFDDEGMGKYPLYVSRRNFESFVDLLYWDGHYAWIKNFNKFMQSVTKHHGRKFICKRCFGHFNEERLLEQHQFLCDREDFSSQIFTLPTPGTTLEFKNIRFQLQIPFVIYADFECLTEPIYAAGEEPAHGSHAYQKHIPCSIGLKLVSRVPELSQMPYIHHTDPDAPLWFLEQLLSIVDQVKIYLFDDRRLIMSRENQRAFDSATICTICQKPLGVDKVRDHDHYTGAFRGAAHAKCNLQMRKTYKVPVFLHNFRGYDAHLIVMAMAKFPQVEIRVIGQGYEKYLTVSWGDHLVFKDSLQFMACSLEQLASNLKKSGADQFKQLRSQFGYDTEEQKQQLELILRKGVYPYDYMNNWQRFEEQQLPATEEFASRLRDTKCKPAEYEHAQRVWQAFNCRTLGDYHELYLKTGMQIFVHRMHYTHSTPPPSIMHMILIYIYLNSTAQMFCYWLIYSNLSATSALRTMVLTLHIM